MRSISPSVASWYCSTMRKIGATGVNQSVGVVTSFAAGLLLLLCALSPFVSTGNFARRDTCLTAPCPVRSIADALKRCHFIPLVEGEIKRTRRLVPYTLTRKKRQFMIQHMAAPLSRQKF
nr:hypothetical protein CFP56_16960 [Quercus suber]